MPINYKKYPPNWTSEIVPRILRRAKNKCECCGLENHSIVYSVNFNGKRTWHETFEVANTQPKSFEMKNRKVVENPKPVKVVLTIAHLDHDETNHNVTDNRLKAMCQLCHLRYDAKEKSNRRLKQ